MAGEKRKAGGGDLRFAKDIIIMNITICTEVGTVQINPAASAVK